MQAKKLSSDQYAFKVLEIELAYQTSKQGENSEKSKKERLGAQRSNGAPGGIWTRGQQLTRLPLFQAELPRRTIKDIIK